MECSERWRVTFLLAAEGAQGERVSVDVEAPNQWAAATVGWARLREQHGSHAQPGIFTLYSVSAAVDGEAPSV